MSIPQSTCHRHSFTRHTTPNAATSGCMIGTGLKSTGAGRQGTLLPYRMCSTHGRRRMTRGLPCRATTRRVDSEFGVPKYQNPSADQSLGPKPWTLPESQWAWCRPFDDSRLTVSPSAQFRSKEVATLEKRQGYLENSRLTRLELKFLSTLRHRAICSEFFIAQSSFGCVCDDHQRPALRTGDARARDSIRHRIIILPFNRSNIDCKRGMPSPFLSELRFLWLYAPWVVNGTMSLNLSQQERLRHVSTEGSE